MRIDRLDLTAFGPFTDVVLDLSEGSEGLHLVHGPNEAGKSSALRAVQQLFRGIPHQSPDNFVHAYQKMSVGSVLRAGDGSSVELVRRKGNKDTLRHPDGTPAAEGDDLLARLLAGLAPADYAQRFVIDRAELIEGGKEVLAGKGDLGRLLFAAAGGDGLAHVGAARKKLKEDAEGLFLPKGSKPSINANLVRLKELRKELQEAVLPSSRWVEADREFREARQREETVAADLDEVERERNRLGRLADAIAPVGRRREVVAELAELADVPRLAPDFLDRFRQVQSVMPTTERALAEARRRADELTGQAEALDVPEALLDQSEAIEALRTRHARLLQAGVDRHAREVEHARLGSEARAALRDLGRDPDATLLDEDDPALGALRLSAADRATVLDLAERRAERHHALATAQRELLAAARRRESAEGHLAALGPERDAAPLRKALRQAQKSGDLDEELGELRAELVADQRRAAAALARLGLWTGPLEALDTARVPAVETIEVFQGDFEALDRQTAELDERAAELDRDAREAVARLERLDLQGEVPTEDALAAARCRRDDAWDDLKRAQTWDDARARSFEASMREADALADRLRREAGRVAERAGAEAEKGRLAGERAVVETRRVELGSRRAEMQARWMALWADSDVGAPASPREMLGWLRRRGEVAALAAAVRDQRARVAAIEARTVELRQALTTALEGAGGPGAPADEGLSDLIERVSEAVDAAKSQAAERKRSAQQLEALAADGPTLEQKAAAAATEWDDWQTRWAEALRPLGLDPTTGPAAARAAVERSTDLFDRLQRARALRLAIEATDRETARFAADVKALARRVAPDLVPADGAGGTPPEFDAGAVTAALHERLERARAARQERGHLLETRDEKQAEAESAAGLLARQRQALADLRHEARCDSDDQVPAVFDRHQRRAELEKERGQLEDELRRLAAGLSPEEFVAEVERTDADSIAPRRERADERTTACHDERKALNQRIGAARERLDQMDGGADAAELKQREEDLRARIQDDAEQYARLCLASAVLREGIERYRQKAQDPVLARASETFGRLTLGSFSGLRVDYDDDGGPVLLGVRPGGEAVSVSGMSLGTADQLFLSLRLATIGSLLDRHGPLPLIVDDVLVQFDDARTVAALETLAALARRAQVIVFTHHEHLVRLAVSRLSGSTVFTHRLSAR